MTATRRCASSISIHHCDRLCLKTISWRRWLPNLQRKPSSGKAVRSTTRSNDYKVNNLAFADDIALLENDSIQAQRQQDSLKTEAGKVGVAINVQKTEEMRLNKPAKVLTVDHLFINPSPKSMISNISGLTLVPEIGNRKK